AKITVIRTTTDIDGNPEVRKSPVATFPSSGGYAFAVKSRAALTAFDAPFKKLNDAGPGGDNTNPNSLLVDIPIPGNHFSRYVGLTPDNTRAYVTTREGQVAVIDTLALQFNSFITLPGGSVPYQITIDTVGHFAYVSDELVGSVYVIDVDP